MLSMGVKRWTGMVTCISGVQKTCEMILKHFASKTPFKKQIQVRTLSSEIAAHNFAFKTRGFKNTAEIHSYTLCSLIPG